MKKLAIIAAVCCSCNMLSAQTPSKQDNKKIYNSQDTVRMESQQEKQSAVSHTTKSSTTSPAKKQVPWPPEGEVWKDSSGKDSNMVGAMPR